MNKELENYARATLKKGLSELKDKNRLLFKRMYSPDNLDAPINDVVDAMDVERLDWAMQQVGRSLDIQKRENQA